MAGSDNNTTRRAQVQPLGRSIARLTRHALDRRGFVDGAIVNEWPKLAGELIGRHSIPDRIRFSRDRSQPGVLVLILDNSALATEVQHFEPVLLERINRYFGFRAVGRIRIEHGPLPAKRAAKRPPLPPLQPERRQEIERDLATVADDDLREALKSLGNHVARRRAADK